MKLQLVRATLLVVWGGLSAFTMANAQPRLLVGPSFVEIAAVDAIRDAAPQTIFLASSGAALSYQARAGYWSGATSWLSVTPASGTTPATLSLRADTGGLAKGVYFGYVEITSGAGKPTIVDVTLRVGESATGGAPATHIEDALTVGENRSPQSLSFSYQTGGDSPPAQSVLVADERASAAFTATSSANWLWLTTNTTIAPGQAVSGKSGSYMRVSANPYGLRPGRHSALISLTVAGTGERILPVTFDVQDDTHLVAEPSALTFILPRDKSVPWSQTIKIGSTSRVLNYTASSNSGSWLAVGPQTGSTSGSNTIAVSVNAASLPVGARYGTISVSAPGAAEDLNIPIRIVSADAAAGLSVDKDLVTLQGPLTGPPQTQNIQLTSTSTTETYSATTLASIDGWLSVSPSSGSVPATVVITADPSVLPSAGTYTGYVDIFGSLGGDEQLVFVSYTVTSGSAVTLTAAPASLSFSQPAGGPAPSSQTVQLSSSAPTSFTAAPTVPWLSVSPSSGTTPSSLTITVVNSGGLLAQTYQGAITIAGGGTQTSIAVSLTVATGGSGALSATPSSVSFTQALGGAAPSTQTVQLSDGTSTSFTASATATWLTVSPTSGTTPANLTLSVDATGLSAGAYQGSVLITAGTTPISVPVSFTITSAGSSGITLTPSSATFSQAVGGTAPSPQTVQLSTSTAASFTAASGATWLTVTPSSGTTPMSLSLAVNASGLAAGTYQASVTITVGSSVASLPVTLTVTSGSGGGGGGSATITASPSSLSFSQVLGGATPSAQTIQLSSGSATSLTAGTTVSWLAATPPSGTAPGNLSVTVNSSGLPAGIYQGSVTITGGAAQVTVPVTLTITSIGSSPITYTPPFGVYFSQTTAFNGYNVQVIQLSAANPTSFAASTTASWLTIAPTAGVTPATLIISASASGLAIGQYQTTVTVSGGAQPVSIPVVLVLAAAPNLISATPTSLTFAETVGGSAPDAQTVQLSSPSPTNFSVASSAAWLSVSSTNGTTPATLSVQANGQGLAIGTYQGTVTISGGQIPVSIAVTFTVSANPTQLTTTPTTLAFSAAVGQAPPTQTISVGSTESQFSFAVSATAGNGGTWLAVTPDKGLTGATLTATVTTTGLAAGQYAGVITITPTDSSITTEMVQVTLTVTASTGPPLSVSSIVNGASMQPGPVAPGEIIWITGTGLGPSTGGGPVILAAGAVATEVADTQVLFDGIPAPLLFVSSDEINAIVPYEIYGHTATSVQVQVSGGSTNPISLQIVNTTPGIFTLDGSGQGQAAIINQDGSSNSASLPAARGSVISIFGTGEGQTMPAGQDGRIIATDIRTPIAPVTVTIGGVPVQVVYSGSVPGQVSGMFQVNVLLPTDLATGDQLPIVLIIGSASSPAGVTVAVK
jgi:uncharacterized protein (TIGR03437 family)